MKKRFFILMPALLLSLTACNLGDLINSAVNNNDDESSQNDDGNSNGNANSSADDSIFDKPESL